MKPVMSRGILVGWKREASAHGILLTLQVAKTKADYLDREFDRVEVALNDRQLRSLARDLERAARHRGINIRPRQSLWQRFARRWAR